METQLNENQVQVNDVELARPGEYRFYVTGVISTGKEGQNLVTEKGTSYRRVCLTVLNDQGGCYDIYDAVFGSDKIKQIFSSVKSGISPTAKFDMEHLHLLIGQDGKCLVGIQKGKNGYNDQNNIKCYIPKREQDYGQVPKPNGHAQVLKPVNAVGPVDNLAPEQDDYVPF